MKKRCQHIVSFPRAFAICISRPISMRPLPGNSDDLEVTVR